MSSGITDMKGRFRGRISNLLFLSAGVDALDCLFLCVGITL